MSLFAELQRRRVFRALVGYGIAAFAVFQIAEPIMHGFRWPDIVLSYVVAALALVCARSGRTRMTRGVVVSIVCPPAHMRAVVFMNRERRVEVGEAPGEPRGNHGDQAAYDGSETP